MKIVAASSMEYRLALECALEVCLGSTGLCDLTLEEFNDTIMVPIRLGHCFFGLNDKDTVVALLTWAFLNEDAALRLVAGERLREEDWEAGDSFWIIDCVAPWGHVFQFTRMLRKHAPPNMPVNWRRSSSDRLGQYVARSVH